MTVVLITGALTGIGRATALAFAREGDQIIVSGRHGDAGADLVKELRSLGAEAEFICADVRHDKEMRSLIDQTVKRFGRLDVAVNNAGTEGDPGPVTEQELCCRVRHKCARHASGHEARDARDGGSRRRQHCQK
jgi:NAD(P)-dependent dehydrogenase (short-subunit alcohol dehydrogenase family)